MSETTSNAPRVLEFDLRGDFYEITGDDALDAARVTGMIATTRRADGVVLLGIPRHVAYRCHRLLAEAGIASNLPTDEDEEWMRG